MGKRERPDVLKGKTKRVKTGCGFVYVTVNEADGKAVEVFCRLGKAGGCASSQTESLGRLISLALVSGVSVEAVVDQLRGISCHQIQGVGPNKITSCSDGVAKILSDWLEDKEPPQEEPPEEPIPEKKVEKRINPDAEAKREFMKKITKDLDKPVWQRQGACPDCGGSNLIYEEGCLKCRDCHWTKCS